MKISEATIEEKVNALMELDGWTLQKSDIHPAWNLWHRGQDQRNNGRLPDYFNDYNPIIALIKKQPQSVRSIISSMLDNTPGISVYAFQVEVEQLANVLLVATGKFEL